MPDITSKNVMVLKGILFLFIIIGSSTILLIDHPTIRAVLALCVLIWSSARFYYFLFYVLEKYVDSRLRYAGFLALLSALWSRRTSEGPSAPMDS
jgi:hypothetical protein